MPRSELPKIREAFAKGWHHIFSIFLLIYFLMQDYSPERAVFWAILATIASAFIMSLLRRKPLKIVLRQIVEGLSEGALGAVEVAAACAAAGIIIGSITMTGLGIKFSSLVVDASMGHLFLALPFTMIACLFLGMGVPTTAQYVIISSLVAPALVQMGVAAIAAHLFILYFGTRADITPPVALAAYAGSGIARSNPFWTGVTASKLAIGAFLTTYIFVFNPSMLWSNTTWHSMIQTLITSCAGMTAIGAAMIGFFVAPMNWIERILFIAGGLLMVDPGTVTDLIGGGLLALCVVNQYRKKRAGVVSTATAADA